MTELDYAREIVQETPCPTVIELGAHHGHETAAIYDFAAGYGRRPLYMAVEADPRALPVLRKNVGKRPVTIVDVAVGPTNGWTRLFQSFGLGDASSSIRRPKEHLKHFQEIKFNHGVEVRQFTLDTLVTLWERRIGQVLTAVDLIWCDIQGAERDMIAGGKKTLALTRHIILEADRCEMYDGQAKRDDMFSLLPGFELVAEWPDNANMLFENVALLHRSPPSREESWSLREGVRS